MSIRVGINGFGRIGRCVVRAAATRNLDIEIVGINDLADIQTLAHLLKYDSVHGIANISVETEGNNLIVNGNKIHISNKVVPSALPWKELNVDIGLESSGIFTHRDDASGHLKAGAKKVIISAPGENADVTVVQGVNFDTYDKSKHDIISNASCTTNCLAPVAKILNDTFGIISGMTTTIHAYTNGQNILDLPHKDLRRARAAALSMIPTSTHAAKAVGLVLPELEGKLDGMAMRVPTSSVSIVDLTCELEKPVSIESINTAVKEIAESTMKGILEYTDLELVSTDFKGNPHSCIFDSKLTKVMNGNMAKVFIWYDNEWGYSNRIVELITKVL